jgi:hypothetical protein
VAGICEAVFGTGPRHAATLASTQQRMPPTSQESSLSRRGLSGSAWSFKYPCSTCVATRLHRIKHASMGIDGVREAAMLSATRKWEKKNIRRLYCFYFEQSNILLTYKVLTVNLNFITISTLRKGSTEYNDYWLRV